MREIKFRGKRVDNGEWVYGDLLTNNGSPIIVAQVKRDYILKIHTNGGDHWAIETPAYRVIPETVVQYTGLKDKDGKEIWEGDILKGNHKDLFLIEEFNGSLQMYNSRYYGQRYNELIASPACDPQTKSWLNNAEVVGNIHDNPELLQS